MYARDLGIKKDFYSSLGLDSRDYDQFVINKTNETAARVFPVVMDVYDKSFYGRLDKIVENNKVLPIFQTVMEIKYLKLLKNYLNIYQTVISY